MVRTFLIFLFLAAAPLHAQPSTPFRCIQTINLAGVKSHFDHFGIDAEHGRLFATMQQQGTVEVFEFRTGKRIGVITGIGKPHAVLYRADVNRLYITDGDHNHGKVHFVDGKTFRVLRSVDLAPGAEQFGYDTTAHNLYIANGGHDAASPSGFVSVVNTDSGEKLADIRVETPNLEGVAVENSGDRVFVNDRLHSQVVVIDRRKRAVTGSWQISNAKLNVSLAIDEASHRLFVGCRSGSIVVFDTDTGKEQAELHIPEGVDDLTFDLASRRIFAPTGAGSGALDVFQQHDPDHYEAVGHVASEAGGKNGIFVPQVDHYFVGVPEHGEAAASLLVYDIPRGEDRWEPVSAPYAQKLVREALTAHNEITFIGLHAIPPGKKSNLIVACNDPSKVGKVSTSRDMGIVQAKQTKVQFNKNHNYYEVDQWFGDTAGSPLGMIVFHIAAAGAGNEQEAVKQATLVRDELQRKIPSRQRLFEP